jgi:hypothetical protein
MRLRWSRRYCEVQAGNDPAPEEDHTKVGGLKDCVRPTHLRGVFIGLLRVKGSIDLNQFWPTGKSSPNILSDADTIHVEVDPATSFMFEGNVSRAFDFAWIKTRKNSRLSPGKFLLRVWRRGELRMIEKAFGVDCRHTACARGGDCLTID